MEWIFEVFNPLYGHYRFDQKKTPFYEWYIEKPNLGSQLKELYECIDYYPSYNQTLFEQSYHLSDSYKKNLTHVITVYKLLQLSLENNQIALHEKTLELIPGTNEKFLDIIETILLQCASDHTDIYQKTKLVIDECCVGAYKNRKNNIHSIANMVYIKQSSEKRMSYLTKEINYLTTFRDSSTESADNATFICADWFKQQQ